MAPILALSEALAKRHSLKTVEFIYTEIGGIQVLRRLYRALESVIKGTPGWAFAGSHRLVYNSLNEGLNWKARMAGGAFEEIIEIQTPFCKIVVRFKNLLSGEDYYLTADLNSAHVLIVHDLFLPESDIGLSDFIKAALKKRTADRDNFLIMAENFLAKPFSISLSQGAEVLGHTSHPYGCSGIHRSAGGAIAGFGSPVDEPIDIGTMGYLHPRLIDFFEEREYFLEVDPNKKMVRAVKTFPSDAAFDRSIHQEVPVFSDTNKDHTRRKNTEATLMQTLVQELGMQENPLSDLDPKFDAGFYEKSWFQNHSGVYQCCFTEFIHLLSLHEFTVPPALYDPRLFNLFEDAGTIHVPGLIPDTVDYFYYELDEPGHKNAVILQPNH